MVIIRWKRYLFFSQHKQANYPNTVTKLAPKKKKKKKKKKSDKNIVV